MSRATPTARAMPTARPQFTRPSRFTLRPSTPSRSIVRRAVAGFRPIAIAASVTTELANVILKKAGSGPLFLLPAQPAQTVKRALQNEHCRVLVDDRRAFFPAHVRL